MKILLGLVLGFLLKLSLYEVSNYRYNDVYMTAIKTKECEKHPRSPHICATEIVDKDQLTIFFNTLDKNPQLWECFDDLPSMYGEEPTICKIF